MSKTKEKKCIGMQKCVLCEWLLGSSILTFYYTWMEEYEEKSFFKCEFDQWLLHFEGLFT